LLPEGGPANALEVVGLFAILPLLVPTGVPLMADMTEGEGRLADMPADAPAFGGTTIVTDGQDGLDAWKSSCEVEY
jgi:hypothetical protein